VSQPSGADVARRIDQREDQQGDGDKDDRIAEVDQSSNPASLRLRSIFSAVTGG
jgi:hypothetical protein